ncbi:MAG: hypothetical protein M1820_002843 [Bogoriella megaspora]|nr:MAG: hypothetical protein M1820_002843 [Bogoriella megaspora]
MEVWRAGEALLSQRSSLLCTFLAPSIAKRTLLARLSVSRTPRPTTATPNFTTKRCFSWRTWHAQQAAAATSDPPEIESRPNEASTRERPSYNPASETDKSKLLDDALSVQNRPLIARSSHTSRFSPQNAQKENRPPRTSDMDVADIFKEEINRPSTRMSRSDGPISGRLHQMMTLPPSSPRQDPWSTQSGPPIPQATNAPPMRLGPSVGKSIELDPARNTDVGKMFRQLDMLVSRNKIRAEFNKQRFHERPGLKRKRLHSERWRRRFKVAFKATVSRVQELRRKGW